MPWLNGKKLPKDCCKYCGSPYHRGWQCRENPKNIAKIQTPKQVKKSSNLSPQTSKKRIKHRPKNLRPKLIREYDSLFSKYLRLKAQKNNNLFCFTCGKRLTYKTAVVMHFISRRFVSVRFDENNVHVGCRKCNTPDKDQPVVLQRYAELLGEDIVEELNRKKSQKISTDLLKQNYEHLKQDYNLLLNQKDLQ